MYVNTLIPRGYSSMQGLIIGRKRKNKRALVAMWFNKVRNLWPFILNLNFFQISLSSVIKKIDIYYLHVCKTYLKGSSTNV